MSHKLDLEPTPLSAREARFFVATWARAWGYQRLIGAATILTSELATNAIVHSRLPFSVAVSNTGRGMRVSVDDDSDELPIVRPAVDVGIHGRGMRVVDVVATRWGVEPGAAGKRVWFELDLADAHAHPDGERL